MAVVYTIEGPRRRKKKSRGMGEGESCKRVKHGGKRGCTIELCKGSRGRWKFQKNSVRCG
jgi:hypothetical protein